jgi:hypothetical protein
MPKIQWTEKKLTAGPADAREDEDTGGMTGLEGGGKDKDKG